MRVVLIADRFPLPSETFIAQRFHRLLERGIDMHVICNESRDEDWAFFPELAGFRDRVHVRKRATIPFVLASSPRAALRHLARGLRAIRLRAFRRLLRDAELIRLQPDIVHFTFGSYARHNSYLGPALGCRVVVSFQGADLNYAGLEEGDAYYADVFRTADRIHFLGDDLARRATRRGYTPDDRALVIKPGVDATRFHPKPRERTPDEPLRILSVGRLHWKKGFGYALSALRILADDGVDFTYRIIGDGEERDAVLYDTHDLGLERSVELLGSQPAERVRDEMQWADILLHAATSEGFCYVVVEAQAMQLPIVTSDADGLPENVADGVTGFVVPRRDPGALASALHKLAQDAELRRAMGEAGRRRVLDVFTVDREIDEFEALYRSL